MSKRQEAILENWWPLALLVTLAAALVLVVSPAHASDPSQPSLPPVFFFGSATVSGTPVPEGYEVTAEINGETVATNRVDSSGNYSLQISGAEPGATVTFTVAGFPAAETATIFAGAREILNLTAEGELPPTPTPAPPTPTPDLEMQEVEAELDALGEMVGFLAIQVAQELSLPTPDSRELLWLESQVNAVDRDLVSLGRRMPSGSPLNNRLHTILINLGKVRNRIMAFEEATPTPAPTPTREPTPVPTATAEPAAPTEAPTPTPTAAATLVAPTPVPLTATPTPTFEPTPTPMPIPTATAAPTQPPTAPAGASEDSPDGLNCNANPDGQGTGDIALLALPILSLAGLIGLRRKKATP